MFEEDNAEVIDQEVPDERDSLDLEEENSDFLSGYDTDENEEDYFVDEDDEEVDNVEDDATQQSEENIVEDVDDSDEESEEPETESDDEPESATQTFEVKHFDDVFNMTGEEMVPLARKGLDYDRIREGYDIMAESYSRGQYALEVLEGMKGDFESVEALLDDIVARNILTAKDVDITDKNIDLVMDKAKSKRDEAYKNYSMNQMREANRTSKRDREVAHFMEVFPNVKASEITQDVWDEMNKTNSSLTEAYLKMLLNQEKTGHESTKKALAVAKQNKKNTAKAVTSAKNTGGKANDNLNDFMRGYLDDDY